MCASLCAARLTTAAVCLTGALYLHTITNGMKGHFPEVAITDIESHLRAPRSGCEDTLLLPCLLPLWIYRSSLSVRSSC